MTNTLNQNGTTLVQRLRVQYQQEKDHAADLMHQERVNIVGAGGALTAAYEQLRNAAENTEDHLLLQNAIRRFYRRLFITRDDGQIAHSGNELAVELTLAGYLPNDTLIRSQIDDISTLALEYYGAYSALQANSKVSTECASRWTLDVLAVEVEHKLNDHGRQDIFVDFAYSEFEQILRPEEVLGHDSQDFGVLLYISLQQALLKLDKPAVRASLIRRYQVSIGTLDRYSSLNQHIDNLIESSDADAVFHAVDRLGAPLRILRRMIDDDLDLPRLLENHDAFLEAYENQVDKEYERVGHRMNRAVIRSIIFLIITKFLIGISIEVPYDVWAHGAIIWLPLTINLLFPPVYMLMLRMTLVPPSYANTTALVERIDTMLYGGDRLSLTKSSIRGRSYGTFFSVFYVLTSLVIFAVVGYWLMQLRFSLVHIAIFFVFFSAASFLGFRISRLSRELEVGRSAQNALTFVRDLVYLPFVVIGQWMSDKYSRVNIVAIILDMLIELPLKTVLRLIRQWGAFIDDRKDQI